MTSPLAKPEPWDAVATAYAEELGASFGYFARRALDFARLTAPGHVVDVAAGAGALSAAAVAAGHRVSALDHAERMLAELRKRVPQAEVTCGDGMALPYADATFDAGFSMFGLMFFPDRDKGFRELRRVLKPGAPAVVASWAPLDQVPLFATVFGALVERLPPPPGAPPFKPPLADPQECIAEMSTAGFREVVVDANVEWAETAPSVEAIWRTLERSNAVVVLRRKAAGEEAWPEVSRFVLDRMRAKFGAGEQLIALTARLTRGLA